MKLLAVIGLAMCAYYLIDVALKWNSRDEVGKGIWLGFIAICVGLCLYIFWMN
jgi:hypothetical protein